MIPYGKQNISPEDISSVLKVLSSDYLTQGPRVPEFENKICNLVQSKFCVAVNSATSALHIACLALGLGRGDILWTTPISFVASANCGLYCGASVDFVDICPRTLNIDIYSLEKKLLDAEMEGKLPKILVVVHFAGRSAEMKKIWQLSKKYNFRIIEDAAHALGAKYEGRLVGSCFYSDLTVFSFHPVKIITTAEGGAVTTNSPDIAQKLRLVRSHGITKNESEFIFESQGGWYYEQVDLGFNYRMTDLQAALGISQLDKLDSFLAKRNELAARYINFFSGSPISFQENYLQQDTEFRSAYHLFVINIPEKISRRKFFEFMKSKDIGVNVHYIPIYHHPFYRKMGFKVGYCENAENYYKTCITLPLYPDLSDQQYNYITDAINEYF